ncbi:MAG: hypothetical protein WDO69_27150 [Pseudomonadota bacterium]
MTKHRPWSLLEVVLATSSLILISFLAPIVIGALAGFFTYRSGPKTLEVIRHVTVSNSSVAPLEGSIPSARGPSAR